MTEKDDIAKLLEEAAITIRELGVDRTMSALWQARLRGDITEAQIDIMQIVCAEFGVVPQQITQTKGERSPERHYATCLYVWLLAKYQNVQITRICAIMSRSRTQIYRYLESIDKIDPKHKSTFWVTEKKKKVEELIKKLNHGTIR